MSEGKWAGHMGKSTRAKAHGQKHISKGAWAKARKQKQMGKDT